MTLDGAGNVVLAVNGAVPGIGPVPGTSPALRVLAESSGTYYGVAMRAGTSTRSPVAPRTCWPH